MTEIENFADLFYYFGEDSGDKVKRDLAKLFPFLDSDNTTRLKRQLSKTAITSALKHTFLLSAKHPMVVLTLRQMDEDNHHDGIECVWSLVQQQIWVIGLRNALRSIKSKFFRCRKLAVQPVDPLIADLPKERIKGNVKPFKNTGLDFFGPIEVTVLCRTLKHWFCLIAYLVTRAVHIDVVNGLDTDARMLAIRIFMFRRDKHHTIKNDNGTNSVGAARDFSECFNEWNQETSFEHLARGQIIWSFNFPGVLHFGRIWERMIRSSRKSIIAIVENRRLTLPVLITAKRFVQQTLNGRLLTPVFGNLKDIEALTANDFLLKRPVVAEPLMSDSTRHIDHQKMYNVVQAYDQIIWNR